MPDRHQLRRFASPRRRGGLLVIAVCCALLLGAQPAGAVIVPQKSIAGIELEMTRAQMIQAVGKPDAEKIVRNELLGSQRMVRYGRTKAFFSGVSKEAIVVTLSTLDAGEQTATGVGIGSSEAEVRAGVSGVQCNTLYGQRRCIKGRQIGGQRVSSFSIGLPGHRVTAIIIGFVLD